MRRMTKEEFIRKAQEIHKDELGNPLYDYSKVEYINSQTKVTIICPKHGEFTQLPYNHTRNRNGCPKCAEESGILHHASNTEEFIEKARKIHGNKYDYSKVEYTNRNGKVEIICPVHGSFFQIAADHLRGRGCPKCGRENAKKLNYSNTKEFIEKARKIHGDKYDYSKVEYVNCHTPITIICPEHGEYIQSPVYHLSKAGECPKCTKERTINSRKLSFEDFITKAREVHGDKYDYSEANYIDNQTKIKIICPEHGPYFQIPNSHKLGMGCPKCGVKKQADSRRDSKETFIEKAKEVHGDKYDYSKVEYVNSHTPVEIICPAHGSYLQSPTNHLYSGNGCPQCGRDRLNEYINTYRKLTLEDFITRAIAIHGDKYDYSKSEYIDYHSDIKIICPVHGEFILKVSDHLSSGRGCPKCSDHHYVGEDLVESWIINNKFTYESQYRIESISRTTGCVKVDFRLIINNHDIWIEYNGIQHYEFVEFFHDGKIENFNIQLERDRKIREYCKINNIKLIEVPYIYKTEKTVFDFLDKTITQGIDPSLLVDYSSLYK